LFCAVPLKVAAQGTVAGSTANWTLLVGSMLVHSAAGLLACGLIPFLLFYFGAMGGGDVKLLAMIGAFTGPALGLEMELASFVILGLFAAMRLTYRGRLWETLTRSVSLAINPLRTRTTRREIPEELLTAMRFAPAVFTSVLLLAGSRLLSP
jgi:prepilin peptidase CpaA